MLSGRLPPGSSMAPRSGKTGKRSGRLDASSRIGGSAEQHGGQHPAALQRRRILGSQRLEELDQLLARLVLVASRGRASRSGSGAPSPARPGRAGTARSPAGSVLRDRPASACRRACSVGRVAQHARLLGQRQGGLRPGDRDVAGDLLGRAVEQLPARRRTCARRSGSGRGRRSPRAVPDPRPGAAGTGAPAVRVSPCSAAS